MFLKYNNILGFGAQVCFLAIQSFAMVEDKICVIESVDGIDEIFFDVNTIPY